MTDVRGGCTSSGQVPLGFETQDVGLGCPHSSSTRNINELNGNDLFTSFPFRVDSGRYFSRPQVLVDFALLLRNLSMYQVILGLT